MGTRNLTVVVQSGEIKVAQYGQWDGYPEGQGKTALEFLQGLYEDGKMDSFRKAVARCYFIIGDELDGIDVPFQAQMQQFDTFSPFDGGKRRAAKEASYRRDGSLTHLSRDVGALILDVILTRPDARLGLIDTRSFAGDSLMCEWAYVVDLDQGCFEAYKGFNKEPTPADSRFPSGAPWLETSGGYEPVKLVHRWTLGELPSVEQFLAAFKEPGEDIGDAA